MPVVSCPIAISCRLWLQFCGPPADSKSMAMNKAPRKIERCAYTKACYLAEELKCFGYKTDCPLYQKSNGEFCNEDRFNDAMDKLINKTIAKYQVP